ncbi:MAG: hypothetical protein JWP87_5364 [Labilithrix sp.]|nr:hypothetical protein [Labilithrix sp.]
MSDIGGVSGSRQRSFDDAELEAMRKDASTSDIANKARRDAGFKESDVSVRGDDRTLNEVLHDRKTHLAGGEAVGGALHATEVIEALGVAEKTFHALGKFPHVAIPLGVFLATQYGMYEMEKSKAEMKDGATRDQLHAAILDRLDVPKGFKAEEMNRLGVNMTKQSAASKVSDQFDLGDRALGATLQLHCDQGMHAARTMIESGGGKEDFLKANPRIAERYASDAAFHNGFDALAWAKKESPAAFATEIAKLESRDARYDAAHVTYRM